MEETSMTVTGPRKRAARPADALDRPRDERQRAAEPKTQSRTVWLDGRLVDRDQASINVYDHGLLYGDGCFEGIRAYNGRVFKLASHLRRLFASAEKIRLKLPYGQDQIGQAIRQTLAANGLPDGYIRLVVTRGVGTLGLHPFKCPRPSVFIITDTIELYPPELYEKGMEVIVAKRRRVPIECLDPAIKSLNYLNNILAKIEAIDANVLEAIMLNTEGFVSECTGDNIFAVKGDTLSTPAKDAGLLHGVTRQFVLSELGPALKFRTAERMMRIEDLQQADEVFLTGTAAEIIGVTKIDGRPVGTGQVGPATRAMAAEFRKRVARDAPED
jgi:branched-chain amino acid aminotransferase